MTLSNWNGTIIGPQGVIFLIILLNYPTYRQISTQGSYPYKYTADQSKVFKFKL